MSSTSKEVMQKVDSIIQSRSFPNWVDNFLEKTFFEKCLSHDLQKNEHNSHKSHEILTIYRHVYQNVVPLSEMETHMDCQTIQPYKCNKKWVVSLTPLPHNGSGSLIEGDGACNVCKRKLTDSDRFRFCSISCKVQAISGVLGVGTSQAENPSKRKRSRKGVPHRAPFF
ncbi:PLATZ transcription factor family protein [Striga asiatica]|uniref:PLATZ transcription factor family protein n=1 Tax=Striga asiatica TaxID=4170 RepID=A0A5A7QAB2_STRAF|nr:PLATZ transcription factor family protein [Striga asiatica]